MDYEAHRLAKSGLLTKTAFWKSPITEKRQKGKDFWKIGTI